MVAFFFIGAGAGAGAGEKNTRSRSRSRSKMERLCNTAPRGMIPQRVMRFKKNLIVLFIVSLESDVIETSIFLNCKTYIKITFYSLLLLYFELLSV